METRELKDPQTGLLAFNGELMVRITRLNKNGFAFRVLNGEWNGSVRDGKVFMNTPLGIRSYPRETSPFREVISTTADEKHQWYIDRRGIR